MRLNLVGFGLRPYDGYGRYALYLMRALRRAGVDVNGAVGEMFKSPQWLQDEWGTERDRFALSIMPPFYLQSLPGEGHWLLSMTEGSELPPGWAKIINKHNVSRVIVPCEYNAEAFRRGGVECPVSVVPGGTEPEDFPVITSPPDRPYTFLALADRGARKGWTEVWQAFYSAFGGPDDRPDVRLIIKARPEGNDFLEMIAGADNPDPRVTITFEDMPNIADFYRMGDCFVIPSRSEGWGMPHREAAMCGLPVITQRYSGMDDRYTEQWAICVGGGRLERIPKSHEQIAGLWMRADVDKLAGAMSWCYLNPEEAKEQGREAAHWLRINQTWDRSAAKLIDLMMREGVWH